MKEQRVRGKLLVEGLRDVAVPGGGHLVLRDKKVLVVSRGYITPIEHEPEITPETNLLSTVSLNSLNSA